MLVLECYYDIVIIPSHVLCMCMELQCVHHGYSVYIMQALCGYDAVYSPRQ